MNRNAHKLHLRSFPIQSGAIFNLKILMLFLLVFGFYCLYVGFLTGSLASSCTRQEFFRNAVHGWDSLRPFENDVLLHYNSQTRKCNLTKQNCTVDSSREATPSTFKLMRKINQTISDTSYNLISCEDIIRFWYSKEFEAFTPVVAYIQKDKNGRKKRRKSDIIIKNGTTFFFKKASSKHHRYKMITKEARKKTPGYFKLYEEYKKRFHIGWNLKGVSPLLGACVTDDYIRIMNEDIEGFQLCDDDNNDQRGKAPRVSSCFRLEKLRNFIQHQTDSINAALQIARNFICLVRELEKKQVFVEDFHGSQFIITSNMSVVIKDVRNLIFYGGRNIFGGNLCWKDVDCLSSIGAKWLNTSANRVIYDQCQDNKRRCSESSRCVGFNASLHLCGLSRWILPFVLELLSRAQERARFAILVNALSAPYADKRKSAKAACDEMNEILSMYEANKKNPSRKNKKGFHFGKANGRNG